MSVNFHKLLDIYSITLTSFIFLQKFLILNSLLFLFQTKLFRKKGPICFLRLRIRHLLWREIIVYCNWLYLYIFDIAIFLLIVWRRTPEIKYIQKGKKIFT